MDPFLIYVISIFVIIGIKLLEVSQENDHLKEVIKHHKNQIKQMEEYIRKLENK